MTHHHFVSLHFLLSLPPLALLILILLSNIPLLFPPPLYLFPGLSSVVGLLLGPLPPSVSFLSLFTSASFPFIYLSPHMLPLSLDQWTHPPLLASLPPVLYPPSTPFHLLIPPPFLIPFNLSNSGPSSPSNPLCIGTKPRVGTASWVSGAGCGPVWVWFSL